MNDLEVTHPVMKDFELSAPKSVTKVWCTELIDVLKEQFVDFKTCMLDLKSTIATKFSELEDNLLTKLNDAKSEAETASMIAKENSVAIQKLQGEFHDLKNVCVNLQKENIELKNQCNGLEMYSRKKILCSTVLMNPKMNRLDNVMQLFALFLKTN